MLAEETPMLRINIFNLKKLLGRLGQTAS